MQICRLNKTKNQQSKVFEKVKKKLIHLFASLLDFSLTLNFRLKIGKVHIGKNSKTRQYF